MAPRIPALEVADDLVAWRKLNVPFEDRVPCMYLDVKGLVTCGVGNLIDPAERAVGLPWRRPDGTLASEAEVRAAWRKVKDHGDPKRLWKHYALDLTDLRLDDAAIDALVDRVLFANERYLVAKHVPHAEWVTWPADAQLAALSIAWACGAGYPRKWPEFWACMRGRDWLEAATKCTISEAGNPGVRPRNEANRVMLRNAAAVDALGLDPDELVWPRALDPDDEPTIPATPTALAESDVIELIPLAPPTGWLEDTRKEDSWEKY